ncbi:MAG: methionyl-tRNA formyltransferase [Puia sp.]|nr:methionyl-tRNA formyltransferase [Puia sp.]
MNAQSSSSSSSSSPSSSPLTTHHSPLTDLRIVFMGTPEFAVASLDALVQKGCNIVAVITAPDKPAGRGMQMTASAVKKYALEKGLLILQPEKLKNPAFLEELRALRADLQIVVAFRMLPERVWNMPPMGTLNLHGSLLPQYRGAAPINWAVINGEKVTGVTTFKLQQEIDTGNILLQDSFPIGEDETAGEVHDRMKEIGARLLIRTVEGLAAGTLKDIPQNLIVPPNVPNSSNTPEATPLPTGHSLLTTHHSPLTPPLNHAPKIFTETGKIDWGKDTQTIHNLIRGLSPFPGAYTWLDGKLLKIYRSRKEITTPAVSPGQYETDKKSFLRFAAKDGYIYAEEIQLEGKKKMKTEDFLRGYKNF